MICLRCRVSMVNYEKENEIFKPLEVGGSCSDTVYETWEIKRCPSCGQKVKEFYKYEILQLHSIINI